jgi:hypothetical protein
MIHVWTCLATHCVAYHLVMYATVAMRSQLLNGVLCRPCKEPLDRCLCDWVAETMYCLRMAVLGYVPVLKPILYMILECVWYPRYAFLVIAIVWRDLTNIDSGDHFFIVFHHFSVPFDHFLTIFDHFLTDFDHFGASSCSSWSRCISTYLVWFYSRLSWYTSICVWIRCLHIVIYRNIPL